MLMTGSAMTRAYILKQKLKRKVINMKIYLVPTKSVWIEKRGGIKARQVMPFLKRAISVQRTITNISDIIKKADCN